MTSPSSFDIIWNAILQDHKEDFPLNDEEATKLALKLFASKLANSPLKGPGRIDKNTVLAAHAAKSAAIASEKKNFWDALKLYNDAIRFCPIDSTDLLTFFRGRSDVLLHLNQKEAAELDIRRSAGTVDANRNVDTQDQPPANINSGRRRNQRKANTNGSSKNLDKPKCISDSGVENVPLLAQAGKQAHLKCASHLVKLQSDPDRGRHFIASEEIPAGAVIIVEPSYSCSPLPQYLTSNCSSCCSPLLSPIGCPTCTAVMFCNETCRDTGLQDFHRGECSVLQHLVQGKELSPMALLVYRAVIKGSGISAALYGSEYLIPNENFQQLHKSSLQHKSTESYQSDYKAVCLQVTNGLARSSTDRLNRAVTAAYLTECLTTAITSNPRYETENFLLKDDYKILITSAFFHHLQSSSCNAYQVMQQDVVSGDIRQSEGLDIGGAIFPTVALLNHSCAPNVARHTHGSTCVVRATRKIHSGEEILDNYGPHYLSNDNVNERRRFLRLHYFFECNCEACRGKWPSAGVLRAQPATIICGGCRGLAGQANSPDNLKSLQKCPHCRRKNNFSKLMSAWRDFEDSLQTLLCGDSRKALMSSLRLLNTMNAFVLQPSNLQARATQVVTLLWSLEGNRTDRPEK